MPTKRNARNLKKGSEGMGNVRKMLADVVAAHIKRQDVYGFISSLYVEFGLTSLIIRCLRCDNKFTILETFRVNNLQCFYNKEDCLVIEGSKICDKCGSMMFGQKVSL